MTRKQKLRITTPHEFRMLMQIQSAARTGLSKNNCLLTPVVESSCSWKDTNAGTTPDKSPLDVHRANTRGQSSSSWEKCDLYLMLSALFNWFKWHTVHFTKINLQGHVMRYLSQSYSHASKNELELMDLKYVYWTPLESNHYIYLKKKNKSCWC